MDGPIERYLDELTRLLAAGHPRQLRYLLEETEAHLHDAAAAAIARGMSAVDSEEDAVRRLGPPKLLAASELQRQRSPLREIAYGAAVSAVLLAAIGCIAVGLSGGIAAIIRAAAGASAVARPPGSALSASSCARWLSHSPAGWTCQSAATADWAAETIYYRLALGILGLVTLAVFAVLRKRVSALRVPHLPRIMVNTIGACCFAVAAAWTLALGIDALVVSSGQGWGQWLSATPVTLAGATVFAARAVEDLRAATDGAVLSPPT